MGFQFLENAIEELSLGTQTQRIIKVAIDVLKRFRLTTVSRDTIIRNRLEISRLEVSSRVNSDSHYIFRLLAKSVFGCQSYFDDMRQFIQLQLQTYPEHYTNCLFEGDRAAFDDYCIRVVNPIEPCDYNCFQVCADLFKVTFRDIDPHVRWASILEYPPQDVFQQRYLRPKKMFWIGHGTRQTFRLAGTAAYAPPSDELQEFLKDMRESTDDDRRLDFCHYFIEGDIEELMPMDETQLLNSRLEEMGFEKVAILGDGNCGMRAGSYNILGHQNYHLIMRKLVIGKFRADFRRYLPFRYRKMREGPCDEIATPYNFPEPPVAYIGRMAKIYEWTDDACFQAMADIFQVRMVRLHSQRALVMSEFYPEGGGYYTTIFCCQTSCHMDAMQFACGI